MLSELRRGGVYWQRNVARARERRG